MLYLYLYLHIYVSTHHISTYLSPGGGAAPVPAAGLLLLGAVRRGAAGGARGRRARDRAAARGQPQARAGAGAPRAGGGAARAGGAQAAAGHGHQLRAPRPGPPPQRERGAARQPRRSAAAASQPRHNIHPVPEPAKPRRASLGLNPSSQRQHLEVGSKEARPRSPAAARKVTPTPCLPAPPCDAPLPQVSQNSCLTTVKEDFDKAGSSAGDKLAVFGPIAESGEGKQGGGGGGGGAKHDDNNNNGVENMNKTGVNGASALAAARRKESRKTSHFDIDTIMEEIDDLAVKRDSSPNKQSKPLPKTPTEFMQRKK